MFYDQAQEELQSEFNAQFDYVREAYGASALDPIYEGWCDHCNACDQDGIDPGSFEAFKASQLDRRFAPVPAFADNGDEEIPF